jgi:hypothetical protein
MENPANFGFSDGHDRIVLRCARRGRLVRRGMGRGRSRPDASGMAGWAHNCTSVWVFSVRATPAYWSQLRASVYRHVRCCCSRRAEHTITIPCLQIAPWAAEFHRLSLVICPGKWSTPEFAAVCVADGGPLRV